jgi:hypothetical protein
MLKDPNFYLTVIGIFLSAIGVYLALRHRYPGRISLVTEGKLSLFHDIARSMPEISILHQGRLITANLVILKASLINSGRKDITPDMVGSPLILSVPEGFSWVRASVISGSDGTTATCDIREPQTLAFDLGLFRCGEYLSFEALAEVSQTDTTQKGAAARLDSAITVSHRIADTKAVERSELPGDPKRELLWKRSGFSQFIILVSLFVLFNIGVKIFLPKPARIEYMIEHNGKVVAAEVSPNADGTLAIKPLDKSQKWSLDGKAFFEQRNWSATAKPKDSQWTNYIMVAVLLSLTAILAISDYFDHRRAKKLYAILRPNGNAA